MSGTNDDGRFERDLRQAVLRDAPEAAPEELRERVSAIPDRRRAAAPTPRRSARLAFGLAATLVVAVVAGLLAFGRPSAGPAASGTPLASGSAAVSATASAPPVAPTMTPTASPIGPEVDDFDLLDADHGWVVSGSSLFLTDDGGTSWRFVLGDVSGSIVFFVDPEHGWVVQRFPAAASDPVTIARTADGGRTWQQSSIAGAQGHVGGLQFFDGRHGVLAFDGDGKAGSVWSSADGGASWTKTGTLPAEVEGAVRFGDDQTGWAQGTSSLDASAMRAYVLDRLYVTRDGGRTWQQAVLPPAPAEWSGAEWLPQFAGPPATFSGSGAVLTAWYGNGVSGVDRVLATSDAGRTWTIAATIPSVSALPIAAVDDRTWIVPTGSTPDGTRESLRRTDDGGRTWSSLAESPGGGLYLQLDFPDPDHGWVLDNGAANPLMLVATSDAGGSWRVLAPSGGPTPTPRPCSADNVVLGPFAVGGAPSSPDTSWFNVFAQDFPAGPIMIAFDTPVIAYPTMPRVTAAPIQAYRVDASELDNGKWTFRAASAAVKKVGVRIEGSGCSATTVVDLTAAP